MHRFIEQACLEKLTLAGVEPGLDEVGNRRTLLENLTKSAGGHGCRVQVLDELAETSSCRLSRDVELCPNPSLENALELTAAPFDRGRGQFRRAESGKAVERLGEQVLQSHLGVGQR